MGPIQKINDKAQNDLNHATRKLEIVDHRTGHPASFKDDLFSNNKNLFIFKIFIPNLLLNIFVSFC
jgi:hypothetical protein